MAEERSIRARCPLWAKLLLILSLAANVAVLGLYLGHGMRDERAVGSRHVHWIVKLMPEHRRDFVQTTFDARRDDLRAATATRARDMRALVVAIRAEPFSPETVQSEMRKRRESRDQRNDIIQTTLLEVLTALTSEERAAFADNLEDGLKRRAERRQARD